MTFEASRDAGRRRPAAPGPRATSLPGILAETLARIDSAFERLLRVVSTPFDSPRRETPPVLSRPEEAKSELGAELEAIRTLLTKLQAAQEARGHREDEILRKLSALSEQLSALTATQSSVAESDPPAPKTEDERRIALDDVESMIEFLK